MRMMVMELNGRMMRQLRVMTKPTLVTDLSMDTEVFQAEMEMVVWSRWNMVRTEFISHLPRGCPLCLHPVPPLFKVPDEKTDLEGGGDSLSLIDSEELDELELDEELEKELDEELEQEGESVEEESSYSNDATTVETNVEAQTLASDDLPNEGTLLSRINQVKYLKGRK